MAAADVEVSVREPAPPVSTPAREEHFPVWLTAAQKAAFPEAICWRDQFPELGQVDLTNYLPFLALTS